MCSHTDFLLCAVTGGVGDDDIDVAVFRFTLGIPGFDDRLIPRYVGAVLGLLIVVNNLLGAQPPPEAQVGGLCLPHLQHVL